MPLFGKKTYSTLSALVAGCQQGEPRAQHLFYERYKGRLLSMCLRYGQTRAEAEDIFQEAFVKIFVHIHELQQPEAADRWVKSIVVRTAITHYHGNLRSTQLRSSLEEETETLASDEYDQFIKQLTLDALMVFIKGLPDSYRLIVNLYLIEGYTHAEIAELLAIPSATVRSQYSRARQRLLTLFQQNGLTRHELFE
ncbi:hypothetical protein GCM10027341_52570 [Spirosoma knui]